MARTWVRITFYYHDNLRYHQGEENYRYNTIFTPSIQEQKGQLTVSGNKKENINIIATASCIEKWKETEMGTRYIT